MPLTTTEKTEREAGRFNAALDEINRLRALVDRYEAALHDIAEWPSSQPAALSMPEERWQTMRAQDMAGRAYRALHHKTEESRCP